MPIAIVIDLTRANADDTHRHYSITGVCPVASHEVCARHTVLPTGPSAMQAGVWHLWAVKRLNPPCTLPAHQDSAVVALKYHLLGYDPSAIMEVLERLNG